MMNIPPSIRLLSLMLSFGTILWTSPMSAQDAFDLSFQNMGASSELWQGVQLTENILQPLPNHNNAFYLSKPFDIELPTDAPFWAVSVSWKASQEFSRQSHLRLRLNDGQEVIDRSLSLDEHQSPLDERQASQLIFVPTTIQQAQIRIDFDGQAQGQLSDLRIRFYAPSHSSPHLQTQAASLRDDCDCPQPEFLDREEWCANGQCPIKNSPALTEVSHLIIHHSAGSNSSSDWPAVVRSIWDFHVNTRGWDDVGYNWIIDPEGQIYQGRGDNVRGAHFCGTNSQTMGVCLLGTFTEQEPTDAAVQSLRNLLTWKACDRSIDPLLQSLHQGSGKNLFGVTGHRDGCATACPGDAFYPLLPMLRQEVSDQLDACTITSTEGLSASSVIQVFPNPIAEEIRFEVPDNWLGQRAKIELLQMGSGKLCWQQEQVLQKRHWIDVSQQTAGVYLLRLQMGKQVYTKEIVKQ
ncbi:MAG: N-acetylmuramoyl-L-alanine amidase [Bacteroidota bacterium]